MVHVPAWRRYLRFWRPDPAADVADELRTHLELRVEDLRAGGLDADIARAQAVAEFGDVEATRAGLVAIGERMARRRARFLWWDALRADLRYAARGLRATPGFTLAVVLTLAVGIGAATTMYGVMQRLLVRPPPHVAAPERVVKLYFTVQRRADSVRTFDRASYPFLEHLAREARTLAGVAAYTEPTPVTVGRGADASQAQATMVSDAFWRTLGAHAQLGRTFGDEEAHPASGARVVVLGHEFWQRRYGGDPGVIGQVLAVKGMPYEIVGIAPRGFRGVELANTDVWLPLRAFGDGGARAPTWHTFEGGMDLRFVVRLATDVATTRVVAELGPMYAAFTDAAERRMFGDRPPVVPRLGVRLGPLAGALGSDLRPIPEATVSVWLVGVAGVLLLVACANVGGLLLLRALRRHREIAVRLALGMSRRRLAGSLLIESAVLAMLGGAGAVAVVVWGGAWMRGVLLPDMAPGIAALDRDALVVSAACTIGTAFVTGLAPLLQLRRSATGALRDGTQHGTTRRSPLFRTLLVAQTALSVLLLVGAGLFVQSMRRIVALDHGMDVHRVLAAQVDFAGSGRTPAERAAYFERALERMRGLPGVQAASGAANAPLGTSASGAMLRTSAAGDWVRDSIGGTVANRVADDFFATAGIRIVLGRGTERRDRTGARSVVVNEAMAQLAWPGESAIGRCAYLSYGPDECALVVGVVEDARTFTALRSTSRPQYYAPLPLDEAMRVLLVRAAPGTDPRALAPAVTRALQDLDPALPRADVRLLADALDPELRPWRLGATIFTAFGALAALLAALGLYAAVAYAVTQRTREIGVRRAVGAHRRHLVWLVLRDGLAVTLAGTALGTLLALAAGGRIADLLFDVSPRDPLVFGAVALTLGVVALVASVVPAGRAARVDPMVALRSD